MAKREEKNVEIRNFILSHIEDHPKDISSFTATEFGITQQGVRKHLKLFLDEGSIIATGATKDRQYKLNILNSFAKEFSINGQIKEDALWREYIRPLLDGIASNVIQICQYGFTEMVNNVLEHSDGKQMQIRLKRSAVHIELVIADDGVGVFKKLADYFNLDDERHAILELSKGKMTTDQAHHTGEGLFFTSRVFDQFALCSDKLSFLHTEILDDWLVEDQEEMIKGTLVMLKINTSSERTLKQVFDEYVGADENYGFSRTHVPVFLAQYGDENLISRSQAKRLLARFDRFKEIMLDFSGVEMVGQAFADEIFHVYVGEHPEVHISYQDVTKQVGNMISRAMAYKNGS